MKCSSCSALVRPVVALDIDGTLGQYHETFGPFARNYWDIQVSYVQPYDGSVEFEEYLGLTKEQYRQAKLAYRQGGMKRMLPVYEGVFDFMNFLKALGVEIWVATTRPWASVQNIDPDTQFWIKRNGWEVDGLLYGEDKYGQLVDHVDPQRVIGVIDDQAYQLQNALHVELPTLQVDRVHNSAPGLKWHQRGSLGDAADWLLKGYDEWNDRMVRT